MEERLVSRQIFIPMPEAEIHLLDAYEYIYMYSDEDVNTKRRNDMEDGK